MKNMEVTIDKTGLMTIKVDTNQRFGKSASGKSTIIASSEGNVVFEDGITVGLNVYTK